MNQDEIKDLLRKCLYDAEDEDAWSRLDEYVERVVNGVVNERIANRDMPPSYGADVLHAVHRSVHREVSQFEEGRSFSDWVCTITEKRIEELLRVRQLVPRCRSGEGTQHEWNDLMLYVQDVAWPQIERDNSPDDDKPDILQEIVSSVFKSLHQFKDDAPFSHWVARITSNRITDFWRKQRKKQMHETAFNTKEDYDLAFENLPSGGLDGFQELDRAEQIALVEEAISNLRENHQLVFRMKCQGLRNKVIAAAIGKSESAVVALAHKAKAAFGVELTRLWRQRFGDSGNNVT